MPDATYTYQVDVDLSKFRQAMSQVQLEMQSTFQGAASAYGGAVSGGFKGPFQETMSSLGAEYGNRAGSRMTMAQSMNLGSAQLSTAFQEYSSLPFYQNLLFGTGPQFGRGAFGAKMQIEGQMAALQSGPMNTMSATSMQSGADDIIKALGNRYAFFYNDFNRALKAGSALGMPGMVTNPEDLRTVQLAQAQAVGGIGAEYRQRPEQVSSMMAGMLQSGVQANDLFSTYRAAVRASASGVSDSTITRMLETNARQNTQIQRAGIPITGQTPEQAVDSARWASDTLQMLHKERGVTYNQSDVARFAAGIQQSLVNNNTREIDARTIDMVGQQQLGAAWRAGDGQAAVAAERDVQIYRGLQEKKSEDLVVMQHAFENFARPESLARMIVGSTANMLPESMGQNLRNLSGIARLRGAEVDTPSYEGDVSPGTMSRVSNLAVGPAGASLYTAAQRGATKRTLSGIVAGITSGKYSAGSDQFFTALAGDPTLRGITQDVGSSITKRLTRISELPQDQQAAAFSAFVGDRKIDSSITEKAASSIASWLDPAKASVMQNASAQKQIASVYFDEISQRAQATLSGQGEQAANELVGGYDSAMVRAVDPTNALKPGDAGYDVKASAAQSATTAYRDALRGGYSTAVQDAARAKVKGDPMAAKYLESLLKGTTVGKGGAQTSSWTVQAGLDALQGKEDISRYQKIDPEFVVRRTDTVATQSMASEEDRKKFHAFLQNDVYKKMEEKNAGGAIHDLGTAVAHPETIGLSTGGAAALKQAYASSWQSGAKLGAPSPPIANADGLDVIASNLQTDFTAFINAVKGLFGSSSGNGLPASQNDRK